MTLGYLLVVLIQVGFAVHVVRTGRSPMWLWIIIFVPLIGCLVYFIAELLPEMAGSRTARRAKNHLVNALDPGRELRSRREALEATGTVENRVALADECVEARMYDEAITLYREALVGIHKDDPAILVGLAQAQFEKGTAAEAEATLAELRRTNPDYKPSPDTELLHARILEALGRIDDACREYETLKDSYPGEEARVRYALLLTEQGDRDRAQALFQETLTRAKRAPRYYRQKEREWIRIAETRMKS